MRLLFKTAFGNIHYRFLMAFVILAMVIQTFASQLEIFALGVIAKKGPEVADKKNDFIAQVLDWMQQYIPSPDNFTMFAVWLIFVALFKAVSLFAYRYSNRLVAIRISSDLRLRYFEHLQTLPLTFYQQHNIGSLSSRVVSDAAQVAEAINACLVNYLQTPFVVITTLSICFLTSWQLSLVVFLGFPLIIYPILFLAKRVKRVSKQILRNQEKFASVIIDFLSGIQTVKLFAMEAFSLRKYREQNEHMTMLERKSARYDLSTRPVVHMIAMSFLAGSLIYGLYVLKMSIADAIFFCGLLYVFYEPIKKFAEENSHIQRGVAAAERMFEILQLHPMIEDQPEALPLTEFRETITFEHVWFKYDDKWVIQDLSFTVKKGETVAIVGPTGAGKSTIVQLLPRLYDIQRGDIKIDGTSIREYTQASLREQIAFVPQRPFLFLDTVAENIAFGRSYSREQVKTAAVKAHADEFISQLPHGYDSELAEGGKNLSGGQQQRLAIARALVKQAPILVMDEATSSLDNVSESYIKDAIRELRGQMTQIIIAHRLSTIEDADRIIYLENGEKVAEGTKEQLLETCIGFQAMWNATRKVTV